LDVFITSWKNPDASMREVRFDDYLVEGIDAAIVRVARKESAAPSGCMRSATASAAPRSPPGWPGPTRHYGEDAVPVRDWTLFTTLVDFHKPGDIEVFIDEESVKWLSEQMKEKGYLDGKEMAASFRLLRSNSLIWHYVVHGWLYGESPPPFDVLYWNMDTTRMPAAMHAWYLRELYLNNRLIKPDALSSRRRADRPAPHPPAALRGSRGRRPHRAVGADLPRRATTSPPTSASCCRPPATSSASSIRR
jgi:polyhydroxyalkanoate synthase